MGITAPDLFNTNYKCLWWLLHVPSLTNFQGLTLHRAHSSAHVLLSSFHVDVLQLSLERPALPQAPACWGTVTGDGADLHCERTSPVQTGLGDTKPSQFQLKPFDKTNILELFIQLKFIKYRRKIFCLKTQNVSPGDRSV